LFVFVFGVPVTSHLSVHGTCTETAYKQEDKTINVFSAIICGIIRDPEGKPAIFTNLIRGD